mmetsp:Transcript_42594/g.83989  ORF Transcript_42594/g.83989 Transcript_42594/m.83989 type:complete len:254 (+) Transcript_42594:175-936(+)
MDAPPPHGPTTGPIESVDLFPSGSFRANKFHSRLVDGIGSFLDVGGQSRSHAAPHVVPLQLTETVSDFELHRADTRFVYMSCPRVFMPHVVVPPVSIVPSDGFHVRSLGVLEGPDDFHVQNAGGVLGKELFDAHPIVRVFKDEGGADALLSDLDAVPLEDCKCLLGPSELVPDFHEVSWVDFGHLEGSGFPHAVHLEQLQVVHQLSASLLGQLLSHQVKGRPVLGSHWVVHVVPLFPGGGLDKPLSKVPSRLL